jgi:hypothetical protein
MKKLLVALGIAALSTGAMAQTVGGSIVYNSDNGHYYQKYTNLTGIRETWQELNTFATSQGGYLVTVTSQNEQNFLYTNFVSGSPTINHDVLGLYSTYLTGGFYNANNQWGWVTGETFNYTNWYPGEPNGGIYTASGQNVITLCNVVSGVNWGGKWADEFAKPADWGMQNPYTLGFIVEYNSNPTAPGNNAVPEPSEWAAMGLLGAGLLGLVVKNRKKSLAN